MGNVRVRPWWTLVLFALLVASAAIVLYATANGDRLGPWLRVARWVFAAYFVGFTVYRVALVRSGKYSVFKAFLQIASQAMFLWLLFAGTAVQVVSSVSLADSLHDPNARVRVLAAEVARHRSDAAQYAPTLVALLEDGDPLVRAEAHASLVAIAGADLGPAESPEAREAWRQRYAR